MWKNPVYNIKQSTSDMSASFCMIFAGRRFAAWTAVAFREPLLSKSQGMGTISVWRRYNLGDEKDLAGATRKVELGRQVFQAGTGTDAKTEASAISHTFALNRKSA